MLTKSGAKLMDFGLAKPAHASESAEFRTDADVWPLRSIRSRSKAWSLEHSSTWRRSSWKAGKPTPAATSSRWARCLRNGDGQACVRRQDDGVDDCGDPGRRPPPISSVQPLSPLALEGTVKSCLAKDPDERLQTAHDVKLQLQVDPGEWIVVPLPAARSQLRAGHGDRMGWLVAGVLLLAAGWALVVVAA